MYPYNQQIMPQMNQMPYIPQNSQRIIKVTGENGARAYQMLPSSSALLLDETDSRIFLAQTDGAGYKTITAYKIEPYKDPEQVNMQDIINRLSKLEEKYEQLGLRNDKQTEHNQQNVKKS